MVFKNTAYEVWSSVYSNEITVLNSVLDNYMWKILHIVPNWRKINLFPIVAPLLLQNLATMVQQFKTEFWGILLVVFHIHIISMDRVLLVVVSKNQTQDI